MLGPLFLGAVGLVNPLLPLVACAGASLQLLNQVLRFFRLVASDEFELKASALLLSHDLYKQYLLRFALLLTGGIALPLMELFVPALLLALAGELLGRYLFFVSVVPKNMAMSFFGADISQSEAA